MNIQVHAREDEFEELVAAVEEHLKRYFNISIILSGGLGPERQIMRRCLAEEVVAVAFGLTGGPLSDAIGRMAVQQADNRRREENHLATWASSIVVPAGMTIS